MYPLTKPRSAAVASHRAPAWALLLLPLAACATTGAAGGNTEQPSDAEKQAMTAVGGKAKGIIVWSS
jgi:hypothetical protein